MDDIPSPKDCLYGAFIYSTRPLAHIKGINFKSSLASKQLVTVISFQDIPKGGQNIGSMYMFGTEPLFPSSLTEYAGQPLGLVVSCSSNLLFYFLFFYAILKYSSWLGSIAVILLKER